MVSFHSCEAPHVVAAAWPLFTNYWSSVNLRTMWLSWRVILRIALDGPIPSCCLTTYIYRHRSTRYIGSHLHDRSPCGRIVGEPETPRESSSLPQTEFFFFVQPIVFLHNVKLPGTWVSEGGIAGSGFSTSRTWLSSQLCRPLHAYRDYLMGSALDRTCMGK
jgi:hypothetical protein